MKALLKPSLSTILVVFFSLILLFLGLFAEVFESQGPEVDLAQIYANPIPAAEFQHLKSLRMSNKHGQFLFENTHPDGDLTGPWQMTEPQNLKVKDEVVQKIVDTLNVVRVRNFYSLEPINISSFSLDNPTLTLLFTTSKGKPYEVKMGLINPIDNSAYLSLSTQNQIYQIDPIEMALESYDLAQLVESRVLAINRDSLAGLELYTEKGLELKIFKKEEEWVDAKGGQLSRQKVSRFLEQMENLKSFSILDNLKVEQREFMEKAFSTPDYRLKLITGNNVRRYLIAEIKGTIPEMPLAQKNFFALSSDDKQSFVLIEKDQLKVFSGRNIDLK
jgi:hypothetical protein